jgi:hypothetical protein
MKKLTQEEFLGLIRDDVETEGSQKALAASWKVSETYLSDVRARAPGSGQQNPCPLSSPRGYQLPPVGRRQGE